MNSSFVDLALYAFGIFILFLTPGPVWVALIARTLSGGFSSAFPLALGVVIGDMLWPIVAILGVNWLVGEFAGFMTALRWAAVVIFVWMGVTLIRNSDRLLSENRQLTRRGAWAGFSAGVAIIISNPKAILFYMGVLPGFFDITQLTVIDIAAICAISASIPLLGNSVLVMLVHRMRKIIQSPAAVRRLNVTSGILLICVGLVIPLT
jgi:threonine/homoserine/homoserine lactone efflux protein